MYNDYDYSNSCYPYGPFRRDYYTRSREGLLLPDIMDSDRCDDDMEYDYFKSMCPDKVRKLIGYVEDKCDELDYDGSIIYDELPERARINYIVDELMDKVKWLDVGPEDMVLPQSVVKEDSKEEAGDSSKTEEKVTASYIPHYNRGGDGLRNLVRIILLNEIVRRRRRRGFPRRYRRRGYPFYF